MDKDKRNEATKWDQIDLKKWNLLKHIIAMRCEAMMIIACGWANWANVEYIELCKLCNICLDVLLNSEYSRKTTKQQIFHLSLIMCDCFFGFFFFIKFENRHHLRDAIGLRIRTHSKLTNYRNGECALCSVHMRCSQSIAAFACLVRSTVHNVCNVLSATTTSTSTRTHKTGIGYRFYRV